MATLKYAIAYGFRIYQKRKIPSGKTDEFICIGKNCYMSNADYEMLEEILSKEF